MKKLSPPSVIVLVLVLLITFSCKTPGQYTNDTVLQSHIIPVDRALEIHHEYKAKRLELLGDTLKDIYDDNTFKDTEFNWVSLRKLKKYIAYLEAIKISNPEENVSGVRIYYAAYPNTSNAQYPGQQTLFMVPTVKTSYNDDIDVMNHLPFVIQPYNDGNPIKGDFIILDDLMLDYNKQERQALYYEKSQSRRPGQTGSSLRSAAASAAAAVNEGVTSTILNELNLAPPPK